jgi:hypothetical protein
VNREPLDIDAVRAAYDGQIRRRTEPDKPGAVIEADPGVMRWVAPGAQTSRIIWSALTDETADRRNAENYGARQVLKVTDGVRAGGTTGPRPTPVHLLCLLAALRLSPTPSRQSRVAAGGSLPRLGSGPADDHDGHACGLAVLYNH